LEYIKDFLSIFEEVSRKLFIH